MTRSTIDFGIDLGTTNSAIAVVADGRPQPIRNNEQQEITPSAVMIDRNGATSVGLRAYRQAEVRPDAVAREFKRAMGTERSFTLSGRSMTPEELSAEVLKALRADVQARLGESLDAAVITVPALFTLAGCEATGRAARLTGIEHAPLLQEPIAAGLAYGAQDAAASGYWFVYDLGGGTFDASLMTLREGRLQVVDHAGDDFLGGKNFDDVLIDYVVDELRRQYRFGDTVRGDNPRYRRTYAHLKQQCEDAKIRLSREPHVVVEVVNVTDDDGEPVDTYIDVSRERYEQLIAPYVSRTTKIIRQLLEANRVPASAVRRVLMVGGPTLTPFVRQRVREDTAIEIETRVDPMTVVAQGAALYAASVFRDKRGTSAAPVPVGALRVDLRYSPVSDDTEVMVGGRVDGSAEAGITVQVERADRGWSSGRVPVANGSFVSSVVLRPREVNAFALRAFDRTGGRIPVVPDGFTITQGLVVDEPPLSRSLGVAVEGGDGEPKTLVLLQRGTRLPASKQYILKTTRALTPGQPTGINIHVVEGDSARADRNDHVGYVRLDGRDIHRPLPIGSEVDVTLSVDTSRRLKVQAFVPMLDRTFDLAIEDVNRPTPDLDVLERQVQYEEEERLAKLSGLGQTGDAPTAIAEVRRALDEARSGDEDAALRAQRRLRELQSDLDAVESAADIDLLDAQWRDAVTKARAALGDYGSPSDRQRLLVLEREGNEALVGRQRAQLQQRITQVEQLYWNTLTAQDGWWIGFYRHLVELQDAMTDAATARVFIQQGRRALERQDFEELRLVCRRLWELLSESARGGAAQTLPDVAVRG